MSTTTIIGNASFCSSKAQRRHTSRYQALKLCSQRQIAAAAHKVEIEHKGELHSLEVEEGTTILEAALDKGLELPHDCRMGVCMTCPAKLVSGDVDQSAGVLSEDVEEKGFVLVCIAQAKSDCKLRTITEDEYLDAQLVTSQQ